MATTHSWNPYVRYNSETEGTEAVFRAQRKVKGDLAENVKLAKDFLNIVQRLLSLDKHNSLLLLIERMARASDEGIQIHLSMLQQRAKIQWLKDGDQCFRVFFQKIATRRASQKDFFTMGKLLKQVNATLLTLIPKVAAPSSVGDYRLISCCNVLYKIITKISPPHAASHAKDCYNRRDFPPRCALKVDLRKAYDTLEWDFVLAA
ncbi:UNVERIFIED_CONTAM: hypothetical protein Slati_3971500 [Sesamum latifolium]|uniref:Reverse transcriptase n=1 Tax=Sesamum latifolium TaxID=2727402 RepID=A0AAW2TSG6_9LAMI